MKKLLLVVLSSTLLSSCSLLYRGLLGVDTSPQWFDKEDLTKSAKKYDIDSEFLLILDTASYTNSIKIEMRDTVAKLNTDTSIMSKNLRYKAQKVANDDLQPVQVRLFTSDGQETFKLVNCYVDPPIPMDWNVNQCFDSFPLHSDDIIQNTHTYDLPALLSHTTSSKGDAVGLSDLPNGEYYMVVMWNSFMIRPSKKLIKTVKEYLAANPDQDVTPIYINNHNAQVWGHADSSQRRMIYEYEMAVAKEALK